MKLIFLNSNSLFTTCSGLSELENDEEAYLISDGQSSDFSRGKNRKVEAKVDSNTTVLPSKRTHKLPRRLIDFFQRTLLLLTLLMDLLRKDFLLS